MAPVSSIQTPIAADFEILQNRVAVALATRERLVKSWTTLAARQRPPAKTQEELDAEDAELFRIEPPHLGLGAPIPKEYLEGDVKRRDISSNEKLRHLMLGDRSDHQRSKLRDVQEKAGSTKRSLKEDSSDDDEGRSALGKVKKFKNGNLSRGLEGPKISITVDKNEGSESVSGENGVSQPGYRSALGVKPQAERHMRSEPLQAASAKQHLISKKPLVDYQTDDDTDGLDNTPTMAPVHPQKSLDDDNTANTKSTTLSILPQNVAKLKDARPKAETRNQVKQPVINSNSLKSSSSRDSSKRSSRASSSDSEPSDLETAIPLALTSDVIPQNLVSMSNAADEAKRAKKREKRARKKERKRSLVLASAGTAKSQGTWVSAPVVPKKLKDRLLDANGK